MSDPGLFAAIAVALYVGHHVGDYWVQTDHQARHKGLPGHAGRTACLRHVVGYLLTQYVMLCLVGLAAGAWINPNGLLAALLVSGVTHYLADRREHGLMFKLARRLPGKAVFMELGVPRDRFVCDEYGATIPVDRPQLATGAWALDQAWHIFWGVFVAALVAVML